MSVRDAMLGILTLGPAYGLQLHAELGERAPHRAKTNVGQIYATLDRLVKSGHVAEAGATTDGLPLYQLAPQGFEDAREWLTGATVVTLPEWPDFLDQVLVARTVDDSATASLITRYRSVLGTADKTLSDELSLAADAGLRSAASTWLDIVEKAGSDVRGYQTNRPKRGRPSKKKD